MNTLVVRLSSLGDVVLTGAVTGALHPVTFLTSRRYAEVAAALPGVVEVIAWEDGVEGLARRHDTVIDLHASPRSRWLTRGCNARRVDRYDIQRRLRVALKTPPAPSVVDRYAQAAQTEPAPLPWLDVKGTSDTLLLFPGAAHSTKRWPVQRFAEIRRRWIDEQGSVLVMGSEAERALCSEIAQSDDELLVENGFSGTIAAMGRGRKAIGADSGLTHLAAAAGIPTVVLLGPTTAQDGFWSHALSTASVPLSCRPCSRFGGAICPIGDHACMEDLTADMAWRALLEVGA